VRLYPIFLLVVTLGFWIMAPVPISADERSSINLANEPLQPIEPIEGLDPAKVRLGGRLFNDPQLSKNGAISCATCHDVKQGGTVHIRYAPAGVSGTANAINVPTMQGAALNFAQFWDGRAATLEAQVDGPLQNQNEMGTTWTVVLGRLSADKSYLTVFEKVYNGEPTPENVRDAIAAFERSRVPVGSPFDQYLKGKKDAISPQAAKGYDLFKNLGCVSCHQGRAVGGNMYQKLGIVRDYFADRGNITEKDYGRYNVTHDENDKFVFKVPSLRNVELTAPYFHDGSAATLEDAVSVMAKYQLGRELSPEERADLVAFLKSLTGEVPPLP
jgi:cytochrome c peroxidase